MFFSSFFPLLHQMFAILFSRILIDFSNYFKTTNNKYKDNLFVGGEGVGDSV